MNDLVLPRPGRAPSSSKPPIPGPPEAAFTSTFGTLLPPAQYVRTAHGKAAYYAMSPAYSSPGEKHPQTLERVLFLHGLQTPALGMLPLARALHASFPRAHFILLDLWGHALTDTPFLPHEPSLFHHLIDALLDELCWPTAHFVGYSFGGALTVGYVNARPSRVQSYTLVAPGGLIRSANFTAEQRAHLRGEDEVAARKWVIEFLEDGELVVPPDWRERVARGEVVAEAVRDWQMCEHPGHFATVVAVVRDGGIMDNEAEFVNAARSGIPSFAVLGEVDPLCPEKELRQLGFVDIAVVSNAAHTFVRTRVPEVAAFIAGFWSKLGGTCSD